MLIEYGMIPVYRGTCHSLMWGLHEAFLVCHAANGAPQSDCWAWGWPSTVQLALLKDKISQDPWSPVPTLWPRAGLQALSKVLDITQTRRSSCISAAPWEACFICTLQTALPWRHVQIRIWQLPCVLRDHLPSRSTELCLNKVALVPLSIWEASPLKAKKLSCERTWASLTYFCAFLLWEVKITKKC